MTTDSRIDRIEKFREEIREKGLDGVLISADENRRYLSGFTGSAGYLLLTPKDAVLATDFRYVVQAGRQAPAFRVERITGGTVWLPGMVSDLGINRLGFEGHNVTVATHFAMQKAFEDADNPERPELVSTTGMVEKLRAVKNEEELALLQKAVDIADQAFERVAPTIEPGVTEQEVAWELEKAMRELGAESVAFDIIVGAGPNGALPHHRADETVIKNGDAVVIDMGARYLGYCSDLTRTLVVGEPDEIFTRVYETVLTAQLSAEESLRSGMTGEEADAIAREIIEKAGYTENFGHSLGHGVGLEVHEHPRVGQRSGDPLTDGMVFSVEPGIYLSGWGGVRIEDMVVLENGRARVMSGAHKSPRAK